jgi:hypothetical protein
MWHHPAARCWWMADGHPRDRQKTSSDSEPVEIARLVNTSRGPIVDALIECLSKRRIGSAALDMFDVEPLPVGHPFRALDNWWRRLRRLP